MAQIKEQSIQLISVKDCKEDNEAICPNCGYVFETKEQNNKNNKFDEINDLIDELKIKLEKKIKDIFYSC